MPLKILGKCFQSGCCLRWRHTAAHKCGHASYWAGRVIGLYLATCHGIEGIVYYTTDAHKHPEIGGLGRIPNLSQLVMRHNFFNAPGYHASCLAFWEKPLQLNPTNLCTEQAWLSQKLGRQMLISTTINAACEKHARSWPCTPSQEIFPFGFQPPDYYSQVSAGW